MKIAADDKDFDVNFFKMLDLATELVIRFETQYGENKGAAPAFTAEQIKAIKDDEMYEQLKEEFLNEVFGYGSSMDRNAWQEAVVEKTAWVFDPKQIRDKLGFKL